jgi:hypothetical protein
MSPKPLKGPLRKASLLARGRGVTNRPSTQDNGWEIPLDSEDTFFIERRISHYGALLKLTLTSGDRVAVTRLLSTAQKKLAMTLAALVKPEVLMVKSLSRRPRPREADEEAGRQADAVSRRQV